MKRLHLHVGVRDIDASARFYATLFGVAPDVLRPDYAKWMLDDPPVNFAISTRGKQVGLDHLGIQVETPEELVELTRRLKDAGRAVLEQEDAACCYARSDKAWVADPQGVAWESFLTHGGGTVYGDDTVSSGEIARLVGVSSQPAAEDSAVACCAKS